MKGYHSAKKILQTLRESGYIAYFAGGWVRDYLMGHPSSDVDIATDAPPEKILELFHRTIPVGIHFGVVIVLMHDHQFEVSTFRKDLEHEDGRRPAKIALTDEQEDALRRDFTINGLFFDPFEDRVIDYVGGQEDLKKGIIRAIGDPEERFREDRLRMIRAVRFAFRFNYTIDSATYKAIQNHASFLFPAVSMERIWQELKKMTTSPHCAAAFVEMERLGLLKVIFPALNGVSLKEIQKRVSSYESFPLHTPPILFVMALFPDVTLDVLMGICSYLKVSGKEQKIVAFVAMARGFLEGGATIEDADWVRLYANPLWECALDVITASYEPEKREICREFHKAQKNRLQRHVERIQKKKPLIASETLKKAGISPGKIMGALLEEAERIAGNQNLHDADPVLDLLKLSILWPKESS